MHNLLLIYIFSAMQKNILTDLGAVPLYFVADGGN
jgi:hypothetical protein